MEVHGIRRLLDGGGEASLEGKELVSGSVASSGKHPVDRGRHDLCGGAVASPLEPAPLPPCACSACGAAELCSPFARTDTGKWGHSSSPSPHTDPHWFTNQKGTLLVYRETHSDI